MSYDDAWDPMRGGPSDPDGRAVEAKAIQDFLDYLVDRCEVLHMHGTAASIRNARSIAWSEAPALPQGLAH